MYIKKDSFTSKYAYSRLVGLGMKTMENPSLNWRPGRSWMLRAIRSVTNPHSTCSQLAVVMARPYTVPLGKITSSIPGNEQKIPITCVKYRRGKCQWRPQVHPRTKCCWFRIRKACRLSGGSGRHHGVPTLPNHSKRWHHVEEGNSVQCLDFNPDRKQLQQPARTALFAFTTNRRRYCSNK